MAIAVVNHSDLVKFTDDLGFPKYTKVKLEPGGIGYQYYDKWVRENVQWIDLINLDPSVHVRITESAQLVGEIPEAWNLRHQQFLEGTEELNSFKAISTEIDGVPIEIETHVNRNAIKVAVTTTELKYKVDYVKSFEGDVLNENHLVIAVFDSPEDTSISYTTELPVDVIWTTKVDHVDEGGVEVPYLFKRAYYNDPVKEESHPWIYVGSLTDEEYEIWKEYNIEKPKTLEDMLDTDFRGIDESKVKAAAESTLTLANAIGDARKGISHLAS
ncbi:hypothetical protein ST201phi2-1p341 [Pseudomonas phage 201phi2-1]|uniref:Uncharacterized protein n=1 Tax=Pseudomonas phage 201phi2-1 TaxID=198110 RepID=B3FJK1_BP201|nr:hypothetical protein ST201phi2-1p341 [Pseudomonas phage 201phi2-1]ABY63166.1 hypothetical protein 201phi2-1p341 [Pseudomonas phage 201phi2-1]